MKVMLATTAGFCFGVDRAIDIVYKSAEVSGFVEKSRVKIEDCKN